MIRPSALQLAQNCTMSAHLAVLFPETNEWANRGTGFHLEIKTGVAVSSEAKLALSWLLALVARNHHKLIGKELKVRVEDPEDGHLITEGTVDAAAEHAPPGEEPILLVVDWKSGHKAYVTDPDENLQLHAYALGMAIALGYTRYQLVVVFLREEGVEEVRSKVIEGDSQWVMLERIKDIQGRQPEANPGPWCHDCWQSEVCPSFRERVKLALTLLPSYEEIAEAIKTKVQLTNEQATELVMRCQNIMDACKLAKEMVEAHVLRGGKVTANGKVWGPTQMPGRASADLDALRRDGLEKYIKVGQPFARFGWRKAS